MTHFWHRFTGAATVPQQSTLPPPPPWRCFGGNGLSLEAPLALPNANDGYWQRALTYCTPLEILDAVNAALVLRRPLLVVGKPGTGKSALIYRIAYELALGPVLVWPINSRSTLREGLYDYDAMALLQDHQANRSNDIGRYITLRALGTALLPRERPRALLIDELDKADPDLPNDLLNVFEEGWFEIPELLRHDQPHVRVRTTVSPVAESGESGEAIVHNGRIQCSEFPFTVITSNGERDFPPAFLRRCIQVELAEPDAQQLQRIVKAHFGEAFAEQATHRISAFSEGAGPRAATDQLLNALHIVHQLNGTPPDEAKRTELDALFTLLTPPQR